MQHPLRRLVTHPGLAAELKRKSLARSFADKGDVDALFLSLFLRGEERPCFLGGGIMAAYAQARVGVNAKCALAFTTQNIDFLIREPCLRGVHNELECALRRDRPKCIPRGSDPVNYSVPIFRPLSFADTWGGSTHVSVIVDNGKGYFILNNTSDEGDTISG
jgi:hypothetical protein